MGFVALLVLGVRLLSDFPSVLQTWGGFVFGAKMEMSVTDPTAQPAIEGVIRRQLVYLSKALL